MDQLTPFKKINCLCDSQAKSLIIEARIEIHPFQFTLSTPHIIGSNNDIFLSTKEEVSIYINLQRAKLYIERKIGIEVTKIDWRVRKHTFSLLPCYLHQWCSKSTWNFASTRY